MRASAREQGLLTAEVANPPLAQLQLFASRGQHDGGTEFDGTIFFMLANGGMDLVVDFGPRFGGDSIEQRKKWRSDGPLLLPGFFRRTGPGPRNGAGFFVRMRESASYERFGQAPGAGETKRVGAAGS